MQICDGAIVMKILFSALQYPTKEYPFAAFIAAMAEEMAARGNDVTVVAPQSITHSLLRNHPLLPEFELVESERFACPIKVYRPRTITAGEGKWRGRFTIKMLQRAVSATLKKLDCRFDVVYSHFWQSAYHVLPYVEKHSLPLVAVSGEDKITIHRYLKAREFETLNDCVAEVICVSSKNREESAGLGLTSVDKCNVIPNGPDLRVFSKMDRREARRTLGFRDEDFIVCFAGRFIHRKGALRTEQAILSLGDPGVKAIYIGSTMKDEDASQEPKGPEVVFKGVVPHEKVPLYMSASDVYVLPTLAEGCSNSIVEAMACGLPVVSSDMDFNYDVLDGSNAILVDPMSVEDIASAISRIKEDRGLKERMSEASLRKAGELSFEKRVDRIMGILNTVVGL